MSDYDMIWCDENEFNHVNPRTITCRNFTKYDPNLLKHDLANTDFTPLYEINVYEMSDVNISWNFLKNILTKQFNKHAPTISKEGQRNPLPPADARNKKMHEQSR